MELLNEINDFLTEGMVDPRELVAKMGPDASDVHVPGNTKTKKKKDDKWQKSVAFTTNAIGVAAAPAAINAAVKDPRLKSGTSNKKMRASRGMPLKAAEKLGLKRIARNKKIMTAGAIGAVGLQVGNATGDAISAKYFGDDLKKKKKKQKTEVKKAVELAEEAVRSGVPADDVIDTIEKKWFRKPPLTRAQHLAAANNAVNAGQRFVLIGTGLLGGAAGAVAVDQMRERKVDYRNPSIPKKLSVEKEPLRGKKGQQDDLEWAGKVSKVDEDKRQVFGWCSLTKVNGEDVVDRQGDYIPLDEVEKSAYNYVIHSRKGGDMHKRDGDAPMHTADLIESFVVTPEKLEALGVDSNAVPHGWWVGFKVNDEDQWQAVKKGDRAHFSIHGKGKRKEVAR